MNWKPVSGMNGEYLVSDTGLVFSAKSGKQMKQSLSRAGYYRVELWQNGQGKHYLVHRLVAEAFIPNPNHYPVVNHLDENKLNNNVENLEWCTYQQNTNHGTLLTRMAQHHDYKSGEENHQSKHTYQFTLDGVFVADFESANIAAKELGLNRKSIAKAMTGQLKTYAGYVWSDTKDFKKPKSRPSFKKAGKVFQYDMDGNLIREYENPNATKEFGFDPNAVRDVCRGKQESHKGFIFAYEKK